MLCIPNGIALDPNEDLISDFSLQQHLYSLVTLREIFELHPLGVALGNAISVSRV